LEFYAFVKRPLQDWNENQGRDYLALRNLQYFSHFGGQHSDVSFFCRNKTGLKSLIHMESKYSFKTPGDQQISNPYSIDPMVVYTSLRPVFAKQCQGPA